MRAPGQHPIPSLSSYLEELPAFRAPESVVCFFLEPQYKVRTSEFQEERSPSCQCLAHAADSKLDGAFQDLDFHVTLTGAKVPGLRTQFSTWLPGTAVPMCISLKTSRKADAGARQSLRHRGWSGTATFTGTFHPWNQGMVVPAACVITFPTRNSH